MQSKTMALGDGRTLSWAELGSTEPTDPVVIHHHGSQSSRLEMAIRDTAFAEVGVRVIAVDRPGYGASSPTSLDPTIVDVAADISDLLDHLGVEQFAVSGYSSGGPYALAIASSSVFGARVTKVMLRASLAPNQEPRDAHDTAIREHAGRLSWPEFARWFQTGAIGDAQLAPADAAAFADPTFLEGAMATLAEGARQGAAGDASDQWACAVPWGFELRAVVAPVDLVHGSADRMVPTTHAEALSALLPTATLRILPDEGHFSVSRHALEQAASLRP